MWNQIWKQKASDWIFTRIPPDQAPTLPGTSHVIEPEAFYISVFLRSLRITDVRRGLSKFYGTVHSSCALPLIANSKALFQVVTTPGNLRKIDAENVDRIVVMNQRLLGPVPYRGGDLELEIGLFSVKEADLAAPYLDLLQSLSQAAGVSYLMSAAPFASVIKDGIGLLTGSDHESILEIGLSMIQPSPETGHYCVIRAPKNSIDVSKLKVDSDLRLVNGTNRESLDVPYFVFTIEALKRRSDWFSIPEVSNSYNSLRESQKKGSKEVILETLALFRRTVLTCPDLLDHDAAALVVKVEASTHALLNWSGELVLSRGKSIHASAPSLLPPLNELQIV